MRLTTPGSEPQTATFRAKKDPRSDATDADLQEQFKLLIAIRDKTTEANNAVRLARNLRWNVGDRTGKLTGKQQEQFKTIADSMLSVVSAKEQEVYQTKNQSNQDPLNYPVRLNNKIAALAGVVSDGAYRPTKQARDVFEELVTRLDAEVAAMNKTIDQDLPRLNAILKAAGLPELKKSTDQIRKQRNPNVAM